MTTPKKSSDATPGENETALDELKALLAWYQAHHAHFLRMGRVRSRKVLANGYRVTVEIMAPENMRPRAKKEKSE